MDEEGKIISPYVPILRPYQKEAIEGIRTAYREHDQRVLLIMATGTGKTVVFSEITRRVVKNNRRVLIVAHRDELLEQAQKTLKKIGVESDIEKGKSYAEYDASVVIASIQTISNMKRLESWPADYFDLIIVDEAHHSSANTYIRVLNYFHKAKVLGVTATPNRSDKKSLSEVYTRIAYEYGLKNGIEDGWLSDITVSVVPIRVDLSKVKITAGDFQLDELSDTIEPYLESIADAMVEECKDRKHILVFLPLVHIAQKFQQILNERGFRVGEINGKSKDRKEILEKFHYGEYNVLVNAMLLTEGFDEPCVDCIVVLRPTKSFGLFSQMVGRGTRLFPGKKDLLLLDFLWQTNKHNLCRPANLIAPTNEIAKKMTERFNGNETEPERFDIVKCMKEALLMNIGKEKKKYNILRFADTWKFDELVTYEPLFEWEKAKPTEKQLALIRGKWGIKDLEIDNRGLASLIISHFVRRGTYGLASVKQINILKRYGFENLHLWSVKEASNMIGLIGANGWKLPKNIDPKSFTFSKEEEQRRSLPPSRRKPVTQKVPEGKQMVLSEEWAEKYKKGLGDK